MLSLDAPSSANFLFVPTLVESFKTASIAASGSLRDRDVLDRLMGSVGVDAKAAWDAVESGEALETVHREHEGYAASHAVRGVPVFVVDNSAVFVRLLRLLGSDDEGCRSVERILDFVLWQELNEYKHTSIPQCFSELGVGPVG